MDDAERRAQRDAEDLLHDLNQLAAQGVVGPGTLMRPISKQLVTWGWLKVGPGEQVVRRPTPRDSALSLRDELAATIAGVQSNDDGPVFLADYLVRDGWVKLAAGEKVVKEMTEAEATRIVARALLRWEEHKAKAQKQGKGPNWARDAAKKYAEQGVEVSADASELTSGVKGPDPESLILAAFAGADRPLYFNEVLEAAAGAPVPPDPRRAWDHWRNAFASVYDRGLIEALPAVEGEVKRYELTEAGRGLHELDGVDL